MTKAFGARLDMRVQPELKDRIVSQAVELGKEPSTHARCLLEWASNFEVAELLALQAHLESLLAIRAHTEGVQEAD